MNLQGPRCQFGSLTTVKNKGNKDPPNPRDTLVLCPRFSRQGQEWSHGSAFCPFSRVFPTFPPRSPFRWALCASMCLMPLTSHLKARSYEKGGGRGCCGWISQKHQTLTVLGRALRGDIRDLGCFIYTGWSLIFLSQGQIDTGSQE